MSKIEFSVRHAVKPDFLDVAVAFADERGLDFEGPAVREGKLHIRKIRRAKYILVRARADGIEAQRREDVPGAHLAAVVVAAEAADVVPILAVHDFPQPVLGFPGFGGPGVEVGNVVRGLVAMDIAADEAVRGNVFVVSVIDFREVFPEEDVQFADERLVAAHQVDVAVHVLRDMEGKVPGVALDEALAESHPDVEVGFPSTVTVLGTGEAEGGVEEVSIVERAGTVSGRQVLPPGERGGAPDGPVVVTVFQRVAGGGRGCLQRHIAQVDVISQAGVIADIGGLDHRFQGLIDRDVQSLGEGVGQDRDGVVAAHAPVFVAHVAPDREHAVGALLLMADHRHGHISGLLGLHQREQRMFGAVGVPQREDGIVREAIGLVDLPVETAVLAVHVHVYRRVDHRVVVGRVEHRFLVLGTIDLNAFQFAVPGLGGHGPEGVEILPLRFRLQVLPGALHAHGRQGDLHLQHGVGGRIELEPGDEFPTCHLREVVVLVEPAPEAVVQGFFKVFEPVFRHGLRQLHGEVGIVCPGPSVRDPVPHQMPVIDHPHLGPERLPVVVVDPMLQVDDYVPIGPFREGVAVHAHARGGRHLGADAVIRERDGVIAGLGLLAVVAESGAIAALRFLGRPGVQLDIPGPRHH